MPLLTAEERVGGLVAGRYRIGAILGEGGTATVFRATHAFTNRPIALKLLRPEHARDRDLVRRFLVEARTASTLSHANVVQILDMGIDEDGSVYLAMELLEGETMGQVLDREGVLSVERALGILRPVMDAVALAHERGIVHRDLKPDNVIVGDRGDGIVRPFLLDFGMAKMVEAAWGTATQSGTLVGTPFYMSPEQAEGAHDVGPATDVWSMGVILYRCFAGTLPFVGTSPTSLLLAIARGTHEPLSSRAPSLSPAIASVVERSLEVDVARRYPDMRAMIDALSRAMEGTIDPMARAANEPHGATLEIGADEPEERRGSRRLWVAASLVALLIVLAGAFAMREEPATAVAGEGSPSVATSTRETPVETTPTIVPEPLPQVPVAPVLATESIETAERARSDREAQPEAARTGARPTEPAATETATQPRPRGAGLARRFRGRDDQEEERSGLATEW